MKQAPSPGPHMPLPTLHLTPRGIRRTARGESRWLAFPSCGTFTRCTYTSSPGVPYVGFRPMTPYRPDRDRSQFAGTADTAIHTAAKVRQSDDPKPRKCTFLFLHLQASLATISALVGNSREMPWTQFLLR